MQCVIKILTEHAELSLNCGKMFADQPQATEHETEIEIETRNGQSDHNSTLQNNRKEEHENKKQPKKQSHKISDTIEKQNEIHTRN